MAFLNTEELDTGRRKGSRYKKLILVIMWTAIKWWRQSSQLSERGILLPDPR
jgi:hypothetical protein